MLVGNIYRRGEENFRLLYFDNVRAYIIELNEKGANLPKKIWTAELEEKIASGEITDTGPGQEVSLEENLTEKQKQKRDFYFKVINGYWKDEKSRKELLERSTRRKMIRAISVELNISEIQTVRLLSKFFRGGMTRNSLTPGYRKRSGKQKHGNKKGVKGPGLAIDETMRDNFEKGYKRYFLGKHRSLKDTYREICSHYYKEGYEKDDPSLQPTIRQFYNWVRTNKSRYERDRNRIGQKDFKNNNEILSSYSGSVVSGIGSCFEIDATHLDIYLVSEVDHKTVVGKPLLMSVVDVYSSMVVGIDLSLQNESWETYANALYNTIEDKVDFASRYGVVIKEEDWPCHYLPARLLCDNGPGKSINMDPICFNYGMEALYTEPYKGSAKGKVERSHRKFGDYIKDHLPGALKNDAGERGSPDYSKEACLTLRELTGIIIRLVVMFNTKPIDKYPINPEMALEGKSCSPREIWEDSFSFNNDLLGVGDRELFRIITSPHKERKPQRAGIRINNLLYVMDREENEKIYYDAVCKGEKVEVHYDILDIRYVYVKLADRYYRFHAKDARYASLRLSLQELNGIARLHNENRRRAEFENRRVSVKTDQEIEQVYQTARALTNGAEPFDREERQAEVQRRKLSAITQTRAVQEELPNPSDRFDKIRKAALKELEKERSEKVR